MADDAQTMQERRRALLRRRVAESGLAAAESGRRAAIRPGERYRLSAGQRRMWFLQAMDATDVTLNICVSYRLTGPVDEARLRDALHDVVARHAVLRTVYGVDTEGEPYQVFSDGPGTAEFGWRTADLSDVPAQELHGRVGAVAAEEFGRPFDLKTELPLRVTLIRCGAQDFVLLLTVHHISWDDDSWEVFFGDLSAAYNRRPPRDPAPQFVAVEVLETPADPGIADVGYWAETLRPSPEPLELPGVAAAHPSRRAERRTKALPADLSGRVEAFAREHAASPFMVLLAGFGALVRRYTGASDFLVSVPVTDRGAAAEGAIGYFGNTLLLRMTARPQDTFASFVDAVRETCLSGFAHQSVGIDRVVREVNPERMGHDGMDQLVRVGFSMRKSVGGLALDGVGVRQLELGAVTAHLPLALAVVQDANGSFVEFEYQIDMLGAQLVDQMLAHYLQLLDSALRTPECRLTSLDMLGNAERDTVLGQSHGELVPTRATTMVELLESAADARPDAVALASDDTELTYAELHRRANRLARRLIGQGLGPDDIVGLRMTTSVEFVIAMLAVLKAGAAYLPIDPNYPEERIDYLVANARPKTVMGRDDFDAEEAAAAQLPDATVADTERACPLRPDNLAYVIYTSGSTGQPKGVAVAHRAIAEHIECFTDEWSMTADDRVLQSSSVSFDASLLDLFITLSLGARLIVPRPSTGGAFSDIAYVADQISRHGVTVLHMVPSMLSTVLLLPQVSEWRQLRHVPVGGEALPGEVAQRFAAYFDAELRNHYGPTEAVVCATHKQVQGPQGARVVPIGVPNRNVYTYVLDEQLQPVPAEVIGELYLGGVQLARGYLGRPALTAERFVPDPFTAGARLYRTGDLVRRNISGDLEFVGRADEQVKIRGFRIELGEVESVIATHPGIRHCLVVTEDAESGPVLAAYLVPMTDSAQIDLDEVRTHAAAVLPEYMVPNAFAVIPEIPLTVSGKLDKRALPAPTPVAVRSYREPATPTEHRMCAIFAHLFGWERVGAEDSFFGLGGHSLLAARLVAQIRAEFGVELAVRVVFDSPTPAALAARLVEQFRAEFDIELDELEAEEADPAGDVNGAAFEFGTGRPELVASARPERLPLSYSQLAAWFAYRIEGAQEGFNMPFELRFSGPLDGGALTEALNDVVGRHEALRTTFYEHEGAPYQVVHPGLRVEVPVQRVTEEELDATLAQLRRHVFVPESGPLIKANLLELAADSHVLLVLVHHIVSDHSSLAIFIDDMIAAYRARVAGTAPHWPASPTQFADFVVWQRAAFDAGSQFGQSEVAHWRDTLAGLPDEISVAHDHSRPPVIGKRGHVANVMIPASRRAALLRLAEDCGATEFIVYQSVLAVLLHKLGGGVDVPVGSPVVARVDPATEQSFGFFANMVVLRNDLSGDPSLTALVARSRDTVLDAVLHQELPIERLVEALNPPRLLSRNPLFQNVLHFRGADWVLVPRDLTGAGETTVLPTASEFEVALMDLDVGVNVTPDGELDVRVVANADLYEPQTARFIAEALGAAFEAFATTPEAALSTVELLPGAVLEQLLAAPTPKVDAGPAEITVSPETIAATQRTLVTLLEELLEITGVDSDDNFFALGGDSIISIKWAAQANSRGLGMTPAMVFEHLTIAELAVAVAQAPGPDESAAEADSADDYAPMSASGLSSDALADLTASWQAQSGQP